MGGGGGGGWVARVECHRRCGAVVAALGLIGVVGDDTTGGVDGPNEAAVLGVYVFLTLLIVVAADSVFRLIRSAARTL